MDNQILDEDFSRDGSQQINDPETIKSINLIKIEVDDEIKKIKYGRITLFVLFAFSLLGVAIVYFYNPYQVTMVEALIEGFIIGGIYLACAIGFSYHARVSLIIGLVFYILIILLGVLVDVSEIYKGIIIKVIIIFYLFSAIQATFKLDKNLEKLSKLGLPIKEIELLKKLKDIPRTVAADQTENE